MMQVTAYHGYALSVLINYIKQMLIQININELTFIYDNFQVTMHYEGVLLSESEIDQ